MGGVESFRDLRLVAELRREIEQQDSFSDIIGRSAAMRQLFKILPKIAESDSTVLIEGASGTGKGLFAHALHHLSRRHTKKFVAVDDGTRQPRPARSEHSGETLAVSVCHENLVLRLRFVSKWHILRSWLFRKTFSVNLSLC